MKFLKILVFLIAASLSGYSQCDTVRNLTITNVTNTTAQVSATLPVSTTNVTAYTISFYPVSNPAAIRNGTMGSPANVLTGLTPATTYAVFITTNCGGIGNATQNGRYRFTTSGASAVTDKYQDYNVYGWRIPRLKATQAFSLPIRDTLIKGTTFEDSGMVVIRPGDSLMYYNYRGKWRSAGSGGSGSSITIPSGNSFLIGYNGNLAALPGFTIDTTGKLIQSTGGYAWGLGHVAVASMQSYGMTRFPLWPSVRGGDSTHGVNEAQLYRVLNTFGFAANFYTNNGTLTSNRVVSGAGNALTFGANPSYLGAFFANVQTGGVLDLRIVGGGGLLSLSDDGAELYGPTTRLSGLLRKAPTAGARGLWIDTSDSKKVFTWDLPSGGGASSFGALTGSPSDNTALATALGLKANLASPALTGTPTAPTAAAGTSTTQVATTAFVLGSITPNVQYHTTGTTVTIADNTDILVVNPAIPLASLIASLPATRINGKPIYVTFGGSVSSGAVVTAFSFAASGSHVVLENAALTAYANETYGRFLISNTWYSKK